MSAAEVLTSLAAAGAELVAEPAGLRVLAPVRLPGALLAAARDVKPALLRVASGRWRLDLAGWPGWRRDFFEERAAIREHDGMQPRDLAERCAYLEAAELPEPVDDPELDGAEDIETPPAGTSTAEPPPDPAPPAALAGAELPAHLADTPEAWAAFLDEAPWIGPAERCRILEGLDPGPAGAASPLGPAAEPPADLAGAGLEAPAGAATRPPARCVPPPRPLPPVRPVEVPAGSRPEANVMSQFRVPLPP